MKPYNTILLLCITAILAGCSSSSSSPPSPMPPSSAPPSSAPPGGLPSPVPSPPSSNPSSPSPSDQSSSPSSPESSGDPDAPSMPSSGIPSPTIGMPGGEPEVGPSGPPGAEQDRSTRRERAERREAAELLKKAGKKIAQTAADGDSKVVEAKDTPAKEEDLDPFIPEGDSDMTGEGHTQGTVAGEPNSEPEFREPSETEDTAANDAGDGGTGGDLTEEEQAAIAAAQEALEKAGGALETAGETLEHATSDEELAAAEADLSDARIAVIIAGQDLQDLKDILEGSGTEDIFAEAEETLEDANAAILIATENIFSTRIDLPELISQGDDSKAGAQNLPGTPDGQGFPGTDLDKELDESIAIFEGKVIDARNVIIDGTPPPTSDANVPGVLVLGGGTNPNREPTLKENDPTDGDINIPKVLEPGSMPEGTSAERDIASADITKAIPEDIPSPQGDDIVAKQLREAASAEKDPALRAKLWDEYRKYKAGL